MAEEKKPVAKKTTTAKKTTSTAAKKPATKTTATKTTAAKKTTTTKATATKKTVKPAVEEVKPLVEPIVESAPVTETTVEAVQEAPAVEIVAKDNEGKEFKKRKKPGFFATMFNGMFKSNPVFIGLLGLCSALALTTTLTNAIGMGLSVVFVLTFSNLVISLIRKLVPNEIRTPIFIVVIATFVTIVQLVLQAFIPDLYSMLGSFLSLIAVNCIILGRAESFASKNGPLASIADGLGMGIGYTLTMTLLALIRGVIGTGTIEFFDWTIQVLPKSFTIDALTTAMGAFIVFAILLATINRIKFYKADKLAKDEVNK